MEHLPPPFFKQGPSARLRMLVFATLAIITLLVDARFNLLRHARQGIAVVLYPIQQMVRVPRAILLSGGQYFQDIGIAQAELRQAKQQLLTQGQQAQLAQQLAQENAQLRRLLGVRENTTTPSLSAQILYEAHDPFTRKLILDKGILDGVQAGQPVIDDQGVVGQITRTFVKTAEVTLLTDRDQAIPVQIVRNGLRSIAYGGQEPGLLDLRFMAGNADVQQGDVLTTSGIDGLYPPGLPVARVTKVERSTAQSFARILCTPIAGTEKNRHLLVLLVKNDFPPPPPRGSENDPRLRSRNHAAEVKPEIKVDAKTESKPAEKPIERATENKPADSPAKLSAPTTSAPSTVTPQAGTAAQSAAAPTNAAAPLTATPVGTTTSISVPTPPKAPTSATPVVPAPPVAPKVNAPVSPSKSTHDSAKQP